MINVSRGASGCLALLCFSLACSSLPSVDPDAPRRACVATTGRDWCDGRCVALASDAAHCGACGHACGDGVSCVAGRCERRFTALSVGLQHACAVEVGGAVWCWGSNDSGRIGNGEEAVAVPRPARVPGLTARLVFAGYTHTCARAVDDSLVCWGSNSRGELGAAGTSRLSVTPVTARGATRTADMAVGGSFSCAADEDGSTLCWGSNDWGALGDGRSGRRPPVAPVGLAGVTSLNAGWGHVCALAEGDVRCWGSRGFAQLGDGITGPITAVQPTPVMALEGPVRSLIAGNTNACALREDGSVWCWGDNVYAVATPGPDVYRWFAEQVEGLDATALYGGYMTWFARRRDGVLVGWGLNDQGQLGLESSPAPPRPTEVLPSIASRITDVIAGQVFACALLDDQTLRCWGGNDLGQLGNGRTGSRVLEPSSLAW